MYNNRYPNCPQACILHAHVRPPHTTYYYCKSSMRALIYSTFTQNVKRKIRQRQVCGAICGRVAVHDIVLWCTGCGSAAVSPVKGASGLRTKCADHTLYARRREREREKKIITKTTTTVIIGDTSKKLRDTYYFLRPMCVRSNIQYYIMHSVT